MTFYVTQLEEAAQKLTGTGFDISDEWIGTVMLAVLNEKIMLMIMFIEHTGTSITTDGFEPKVMNMELKDNDLNNELSCLRYQHE